MPANCLIGLYADKREKGYLKISDSLINSGRLQYRFHGIDNIFHGKAEFFK